MKYFPKDAARKTKKEEKTRISRIYSWNTDDKKTKKYFVGGDISGLATCNQDPNFKTLTYIKYLHYWLQILLT